MCPSSAGRAPLVSFPSRKMPWASAQPRNSGAGCNPKRLRTIAVPGTGSLQCALSAISPNTSGYIADMAGDRESLSDQRLGFNRAALSVQVHG